MIHRALLLIALCGLFGQAHGAERIFLFDANIALQSDGTAIISETIVFDSEGALMGEGFARRFPDRDVLGRPVTITEALSASLEGDELPFRLVQEGNVQTILLGGPSQLPSGRYTYRLTYETGLIVSPQKLSDDVFWHVNGYLWPVPVARARAKVKLPPSASGGIQALRSFTGPPDQRQFTSLGTQDGKTTARFVSTGILAPGESLSVAVLMQKDLISTDPVAAEERAQIASEQVLPEVSEEEVQGVIFWVCLAWLIVYGIFAATKVRPQRPLIVEKAPALDLPEDISPALAGGIWELRRRPEPLAAAWLSLAAKGRVSLRADEHLVLTLEDESEDGLPPEETYLIQFLKHHGGSARTDEASFEKFERMAARFQEKLEHSLGTRFFSQGGKAIFIGVFITAVLGILLVTSQTSGAWIITGLMVLAAAASLQGLERYTTTGMAALQELIALQEGMLLASAAKGDTSGGAEQFKTLLPYALVLGVEGRWQNAFIGQLPEEGFLYQEGIGVKMAQYFARYMS